MAVITGETERVDVVVLISVSVRADVVVNETVHVEVITFEEDIVLECVRESVDDRLDVNVPLFVVVCDGVEDADRVKEETADPLSEWVTVQREDGEGVSEGVIVADMVNVDKAERVLDGDNVGELESVGVGDGEGVIAHEAVGVGVPVFVALCDDVFVAVDVNECVIVWECVNVYEKVDRHVDVRDKEFDEVEVSVIVGLRDSVGDLLSV